SADPEAPCFDRPEAPGPITDTLVYDGAPSCEERTVTVGSVTTVQTPVWDEEIGEWVYGPAEVVEDTRHEVVLDGEEIAACDFVPPVTPPVVDPPTIDVVVSTPPVVTPAAAPVLAASQARTLAMTGP